MKIVNDDIFGIGQEGGAFVYVNIDKFGDIDCGISMCSGDDYKPNFLSDAPLVTKNDDNLEFDFYGRSPLDHSSKNKIGILNKNELGKMIESLTNIYHKMD